MQMLSQLSYRPVPRIIPNHRKHRQRTLPGVTTDRTIDLDADRGEGVDAADGVCTAAQARADRQASLAASLA